MVEEKRMDHCVGIFGDRVRRKDCQLPLPLGMGLEGFIPQAQVDPP